jgi:hypothetical protein
MLPKVLACVIDPRGPWAVIAARPVGTPAIW